MSNLIQEIPHVAQQPLSIEREMKDGREIIVIDGVHYEADCFRTFGAPATNVLYAVERLNEGCVKLTLIESLDKAKRFFEEVDHA